MPCIVLVTGACLTQCTPRGKRAAHVLKQQTHSSCLLCLTSCAACWRKPPPPQALDCSRKPWRPLKETQTSGAPWALPGRTPSLTQESLSVALPGNNICLSSAEHALDERGAPLRRGWGADGPWMQLNHVSVWAAQKSQWEWGVKCESRERESWSCGCSRPTAGSVLSGYLFPRESES